MFGATKKGEMYRTLEMMQEHIAGYSPEKAVMYILYTLHGTSRCSDNEVLELADLACEYLKMKEKL